ncbi:hypothetical protein WDH52_18970 [Streptomyces sp. TRM70308]|uniref:hypothetical protein n=1 Tax=Streptomyces sp. TRM70308 TaxID=3131932 RepID=UPI003CFEA324
MNYGEIAATGGGLSLFGLAFGQVWLVVLACAVVLAGALLVRVTFRRGKRADQL